ncbi:MAG TPA: DNA translocase FtsK [Candidatus Pelethocola excrementipullorum]|nr:DNA translocase FtsK [Candidatus Pelethocola excrementipullorum]
MAQPKKRKTTKPKTSAKKNTRTSSRGKGRGKSKKPVNSGLSFEIIELLILAACILLVLANFGLGGVVGGAVSDFFFGMLGVSAYAFPILFFLGTAFYYVNRSNVLIRRKILGATAFYWLFCGFMQLLTIGYEKGAAISDYYMDSSYNRLGGGVMGGILVKLLGFAFGSIGAYVILIIGMVIAAIVATQRPLLEHIHKSGSKAYSNAKEYHAKASETRRIQKDERQEKRQLELDERREIAREARMERAAKSEDTVQTEIPDLIITRNEESKEEHVAAMAPVQEMMEITPEEQTPASTDPIEEPKKERNRKPRSSKVEIETGIQDIQKEITRQPEKKAPEYKFPPISLLKRGKGGKMGDSDAHLRATASKLQQTLDSFGVNVTVTNVSCGPTVTRYELQPEHGVKVSKIVNLADDIKLNLAAADIRIEAPIPGKAAVGIEVPNATNSAVMLRDLLDTEEFQNFPSSLAFAAGKDIAGKPVITDIAKMPHVLIAGATGSGKSVCINTLIMSILYKAKPEDVKLIMIDPKVVELSVYNGIPHLFIPVVTDPKKAAGALNWAVAEMSDRYNKFAEYNVRDLKGYNAKVAELDGIDDENKPQKLPQIVIIVDELADLMMVAPGEVEDAICRLAQLARAAGLHLIIATQRPSVNVITGLIKANMPSRIAFSVSSGVDSRTILDMNGAEKLLGKGDMLFYPQGYQKPARLQGAFVSDKEVADVVNYLTKNAGEGSYDSEIQKKIESTSLSSGPGNSGGGEDRDENFVDAGKFIIEKDKASIGMLQRMFKIGFNRAARIMDQLSEAGVVGPEEGTKPRKVLMSMEQFENYLEESG